MIQIITANKVGLFDALRKRIADGEIPEWEVDDQGDFTYANAAWRRRAWMRPKKTTSGIRVNIVGVQGAAVDRETYAVFHGRFLEMLLEHFDQMFEEATATALGTASDLI